MIVIVILEDRKGTNGVSANGVTANFMFFDGGTFWVPPLTSFYVPKSARVYLFPQSVEIHYFCSGPIDPFVRNQGESVTQLATATSAAALECC